MTPQLFDLLKETIGASIRVSVPCRIESFDSTSQTCTLVVGVKEPTPTGTYTVPPVLVGVPVQFPGGSQFAVTFPLTKGDEGICVFSDRDTDNWVSDGGDSEPLTPRQHHLADAFFIPGIRSNAHKLSEVKTDAIVVGKQTDIGVRVSSGKVELGVAHADTATEAAVLGTTQKSALDTYVTTVNAAGVILNAVPAATDPATVITLCNALKVWAMTVDSSSSSLKSSLANSLSTKVKVK